MKRKNVLVTNLIVSLLMIVNLCTGLTIHAEEANDAVRSAQEGVYAVQLVYHDDASGESIPFVGGTAFFINKNTLLTCDHVVNMDSTTESSIKQYAEKKYGSYSKSNISIEIVLQSDITVEAQLSFSSEKGDWAVLEMMEDIKCMPMVFGNSSQCKNTQSVYAIGYPASVANTGSIKNYTHSDITITNGKISKITSIGGVGQIQHGATLSPGVSGGPLVDDNGAVIGINAAKVTDQDYYYSISTDQILSILDQKNIEYTRDNGTGVVESSDEIKARLDKALTSAKEVDLSKYTKDSASELKTAIDRAERAKNSSENTEALRSAVDELESAMLALQTKSISQIIIIIIVAACLLCAAVIVIVIAAVRKRKRRKHRKAKKTSVPRRIDPDAEPAVSKIYILTRNKNGERAVIDHVQFTVGKERNCDYCIEDNSSISRSHARFILRGNECFIMDLRSTNGTSVNGTRISPNQEYKLKPGDIIKLSDEEFQISE